MTIQQAVEIKATQKTLIAQRGAALNALSIFTTVFNGDVKATLAAVGLPENATYAQVNAEYNRIDKEIKNLPVVPLKVFLAMKAA